MWENLTKLGGVTNTVTLPTDGVVSVVVPKGVDICAYVNGVEAPMQHLHVKAGDSLYFELAKHSNLPTDVSITYNGETHNLSVIPDKSYEDKEVSAESYIEVLPGETHHHKHKHYYTMEKEVEMTPAETINLFANPGMGAGSGIGAGAGAGLGAGLLGGVLGGALLGNRGLLGGTAAVAGEVVTPVTPAFLAASLAQVTDTAQNSMVLQTLGDIKASIPLAEGQVQLALSVAQADINNHISNAQMNNTTGQALINKNISDAIATSLASQSSIKETVLTTGSANLTATLNSKFELAAAIRDDGDKTRALIVAQNDATLNRELAVAQSALLEQRAIGRSREVEVNVTQTVSQNQAQLQAQSQQQQQFLITNNLLQAILSQAQVAQATNQSLIIGNTGAVVGGPQNANPTNVRA